MTLAAEWHKRMRLNLFANLLGSWRGSSTSTVPQLCADTTTMKDFAGLGHLFVASFLFYFSSYMVIPAITDVTMAAVCPGRDECSVAIYLSGFQNAVSNRASPCFHRQCKD
jgi:hypothetical protein